MADELLILWIKFGLLWERSWNMQHIFAADEEYIGKCRIVRGLISNWEVEN